MKVTLKDIAKDTGYAESTVSRVLNSTRKMNPKTARIIYQSAKKLNYFMDRSMVDDRFLESLRIGLLLSYSESPDFFASIQQGFNYAAQQKNILFSVTSLPSITEFVSFGEKHASQYDGLLLVAPECTAADYQKIKAVLPTEYPVISCCPTVNPDFTTVTFDGYSGGYVAAEHLASQGYHNCGIIQCHKNEMAGRQISNGFNDYISQHNNMRLTWEYRCDSSRAAGQQAFHLFQDLKEKPDGLFISSDTVCHTFQEEALDHNYTIPDDLALIGYGNQPVCEQSRPALTSINTDYGKLGDLSLSMMQKMHSFSDVDERITNLVPVSLKERKST